MKLKILLLSPFVANNIEICPPLGLSYIFAMIRKKFPKYRVDVLDLNVQSYSREILRKKKYDLIGIGFTSPCAEWVYSETVALKEMNKEVTIVHGGVHPTLFPDASLEQGADIVVRGEGEKALAGILEGMERTKEWKVNLGKIKGISYRREDQYFHNEDMELISCLDELSFPLWDRFELKRYNHNLHVKSGFALPIVGSRGCRYNCDFCCSPHLWRRKLRLRSAKNIYEELKFCVRKYKIRKFHFYDDDIFSSVENLKELCEKIIKTSLQIEFVIMARVDTINRNRQLLPLLKKAGCCLIEIGIESPVVDILKNMNKCISIEQIIEVSRLIEEYQIEPFYLMMFAYDGETIKSLYETNEIMTKITGKSALCAGAYATPYPGSAFSKNADQRGHVLFGNGFRSIQTDCTFIPNSFLKEIPKKNVIFKRYDYEFMATHFIQDLRKYGLEETIEKIKMLVSCINNEWDVETLLQKLFEKNRFLEKEEIVAFGYRYLNYMSQLGLIISNNEDYQIHCWYTMKREENKSSML